MIKSINIYVIKLFIGYSVHLKFYDEDNILLKETYEFALTKNISVVKVVDNIYWARIKLDCDDITILTDVSDNYIDNVLKTLKQIYGIDG